MTSTEVQAKQVVFTFTKACLFRKDCRPVVGGLLFSGISNSVLTPPAAAADVAAVIPACFIDIFALLLSQQGHGKGPHDVCGGRSKPRWHAMVCRMVCVCN